MDKSNNCFNAQLVVPSALSVDMRREAYNGALNIQILLSEFRQLLSQANHVELDIALILEMSIQAIGTLLKENEQLKENEFFKSKHNSDDVSFLYSLPVAAYAWNNDNKIIAFNKAASDLFGYKLSEVVGANFLDILAPPEVHDLFWEKVAGLQGYPHGLPNQSLNLTKDGRRIICGWINFPLFDKEGNCVAYAAIAAQETAKNELMEDQFRQSEARWQSYWENIPDGIAEIDLEGRILSANRALYGESAGSNLISTNLFDYIPEERRATLNQVIKKAKQTGMPQTYELPIVDERQAKWWSNIIIPLKKYENVKTLLVVSSDVTERKMAYQKIEQQVQERTQVLLKINQELKDEIHTRKQIESSLRESESRYYRLTSICPVGIFRGDSKGRTIYMNERCAELVGLPLHEALGYGWSKTIHPDDFERVMKETQYAWDHQISYKTKLRHLRKDGSVVWVIAEFLTEVDEEGNFKGFVGTLTDVTRLEQAEEKIHQHQIELEHRARINMVGEMISGIAHEVNQPLAMIVNYTGGCLEYLQREENVSPQILTMMQRVFEQAERAGKIIHRLKEFLRKGTLEREVLDVNFIIKEILSLVEGVLKDAKINLNLNLSDKLPPVFIDKIQIEQVILNLIHNAVDAMKNSEWLFRQINIQSQLSAANPNQIEIRVADTGPGIPADIADKVFDAFFTTKEKGMGVGLSISATILEVHGGRISLDRSYKEGTAFIITLPIKERSDEHE